MNANFSPTASIHTPDFRRLLLLGLLGWPLLGMAAGEVVEVDSLEWITMGMGLFGGLALFLFGMEQMSQGLKAVAGEGLKNLLEKLTKNRIGDELFETVQHALELAIRAVRDEDEVAAQEVLTLKVEVDARVEQALSHQAKRLASNDSNWLEIIRYDVEAIDKLKRIYTLTKRNARLALPAPLAAQAA